MRHLRRWGAAYILALLFVGSWLGQLVAMQSKIQQEGWAEFWSATFENWQSEWLQLLAQALLVVALADQVFRRGVEDSRRIEAKLDRLLEEREKRTA